MKVTKKSGPPKDLVYFDEDLNLTKMHVEDVVEILFVRVPHTNLYTAGGDHQLLGCDSCPSPGCIYECHNCEETPLYTYAGQACEKTSSRFSSGSTGGSYVFFLYP